MSIEVMFTTTVANKRMTWVGNAASETTVTSFMAHVQQARPEMAIQLGEALGKTFSIWCALGTDVAEGDTLTIENGSHAGTYNVRNVQKNAVGDEDDHLELVAIKDL